jgi:hypothetical protein
MSNLSRSPRLAISPDAPYENRATNEREDHITKALLWGGLFWITFFSIAGWLVYACVK